MTFPNISYPVISGAIERVGMVDGEMGELMGQAG